MAYFKADVKCYHCGRVSGTISGVHGRPLRECTFTKRGSFTAEAMPSGTVHCAHCNGPVFLDDIEVMAARPLEQIARRERDVA